MRLEPFSQLRERALMRKGSERILQQITSTPLPAEQMKHIPDHRFLAEFTKKVFQSGFVWRVVRQKWPDFEEIFFGFDIEKILLMPDEMFEQKAANPKIIRNLSKVMTIRENALMIKAQSDEYGSFATFVSQFQKSNIIDLWMFLQKNGARLGGNTGPYGLRTLGIDTFLLTQDVEAYFRHHGHISGSLRSKRSLTTIQEAFTRWHEESGLSLQEVSQILSFGVGDNYVGVRA